MQVYLGPASAKQYSIYKTILVTSKKGFMPKQWHFMCVQKWVFPANLWRLGLTGLLVLFLCMWSLFLSVCLIVSIWTCNLKLKWFLYPAQPEFIHFHKKYQSHENWKQKNDFKYVLNGFKIKTFYRKKQLKAMIAI